ncbi:hypothetical protein PFTANZ_06138, partial [Plasmodium falciparum Tanzania (2000708)]
GDKTSMEKIQEKIDTILKQSGNNKGTSDTQQQTEREKREEFWKQHGKHIWEGMVCALTYEDEGARGESAKIKQNNDLKQALLDNDGNKPQKPQYHYDQVKLDENSGTRPKPQTGDPSSSDTNPLNNPKLTQFVVRPTYFRYLEEWGQNFCTERKKRLEKIKEECVKSGGERCSGDGENCKDIRTQDYSTVRDFNCPSCGKSCRFYKKWIKTKKDEFIKQKEEYSKQKNDAQSNNNDYKEFSKTLGNYNDAAKYLERLKNGPCKTNKENNKGEDEIKFDENHDTFQHTEYCDPCPKFKTNCQNGDCKGANGNTCNGETVTAENFKDKIDCKDVFMRVSDSNKTGFDDLEDACQKAGIFDGIRKEQWKCGYVCGVDVCKLENVNGKKVGASQNQKHIIQIRALLKRWVEYFIQDYNKIKNKLKPCIENGEKPKCENKCNDKCNCASKWIDEKRTEWQEIKKRYVKQYNGGGTEKKTLVKNFLEDLQSQIDFKKATGREKISDFESSCHCNGADSSKSAEDGKERDIVECLLDKLQTKATSCPNQASDKPEALCEKSPTHVEDDDEPIEEEDPENKIGQRPSFCPEQQQEEVKEESGCEPASPDEEKQREKEKEKEKDKGDEETEQAAQPPRGEQKPEKVPPSPVEPRSPAPEELPSQPIPQPSDNTSDILATTIPFGVALALGSIAFLFLK